MFTLQDINLPALLSYVGQGESTGQKTKKRGFRHRQETRHSPGITEERALTELSCTPAAERKKKKKTCEAKRI
jgi:hypothetical protein